MKREIGLLSGRIVWWEAGARTAILILSLLLMAEFSLSAASIGWAQSLLEVEPATGEPDRKEKSYWRSMVKNLTLIEVDSLHSVVREMQDAGSITNYEFLVQSRGADYEVLIQAEIVDVVQWAAFRGLDVKNISTGSSDYKEARFADDTTRDQPHATAP